MQIIVQVAIKQERPKIDADTPEDLRRLIQKCWHPDPRVRPSCAEVMRLSEILLHQERKKELKWAESQAKLSHRYGCIVSKLLTTQTRLAGWDSGRQV